MSRKGENIYRRKDGRWESRYIKSRDNGKINYGYVYAKTYREVKQRLIECYSSYSLPVNSEAVSLPTDSFVTVAEECFAVSRSQLKASSSVKYYAIVNKHLIPTFSGELISNISRESVIQLSNRLLSDENSLSLSPKAVTSIMCVLKSIFDYASQVKQYRVPDIRGISIRQLQCQLRILMCLYTGLRLGEICALKWGDILLNEKITYVHQTMQRLKTVDIETKKTEIPITISVPKYIRPGITPC